MIDKMPNWVSCDHATASEPRAEDKRKKYLKCQPRARRATQNFFWRFWAQASSNNKKREILDFFYFFLVLIGLDQGVGKGRRKKPLSQSVRKRRRDVAARLLIAFFLSSEERYVDGRQRREERKLPLSKG